MTTAGTTSKDAKPQEWELDIYQKLGAPADYINDLGGDSVTNSIKYLAWDLRVVWSTTDDNKTLKTVLLWDCPKGCKVSRLLQEYSADDYTHDWVDVLAPVRLQYTYDETKTTIHVFSCCDNGKSMRSEIKFLGAGESLNVESYEYGPRDQFSRLFTYGTASIVGAHGEFLFAGGLHPARGIHSPDRAFSYDSKCKVFQVAQIVKNDIKETQIGRMPVGIQNGRCVQNGALGCFLVGIEGVYGYFLKFDATKDKESGKVKYKCEYFDDLYDENHFPSCEGLLVQSCHTGCQPSRLISVLTDENTNIIKTIVHIDWETQKMHSIGVHPIHKEAATAFAAIAVDDYHMMTSLGCCDIVTFNLESIGWQQIRLLWIGFMNNTKNEKCFISRLPKDVVKYLMLFCGNVDSCPLFGAARPREILDGAHCQDEDKEKRKINAASKANDESV